VLLAIALTALVAAYISRSRYAAPLILVAAAVAGFLLLNGH
jgi:hypothetical protein